MRKELLTKFDNEGMFHMNVMGMKETKEEVKFFLAENETINAYAVYCMKDFGYNNNLQFTGVTVETDENKIIIDEFFKNNYSTFDVEMCMVVNYKKKNSGGGMK